MSQMTALEENGRLMHPTPTIDWLPLAREQPIRTKPLNLKFIKVNKRHDWFLSLAWAMHEADDSTQCRMLAKVYLFLRDYMPRGLSNTFAHIQGEDVMHHLLCHVGEHAVSRHKATRDADAALAELESWMKKGKDWREALKNAKADNIGDDGAHRRKTRGRCPALYSPAGMLALLVIAHPDAKFKDRIGRLGIDWMVRSRETLDVRSGYWKGINNENLYDVFLPEEPRRAELPLLANYTRLLGKDFAQCRKDIRPYLQPWAHGIRLEEEPTGLDELEEDGETSYSADVVAPEALELRKHLNFKGSKTLDELERWLITKLAIEDQGGVLSTWCEFWSERIEQAMNYGEQVIVQSLFHRSAHRLDSLYTWEDASPQAYMLLDMEDYELKPQQHDTKLENLQRQLSKTPPYIACADANAELVRLVERSSVNAAKLVKRIAARQVHFFCDLLASDLFCQYAISVMALDKLRTQLIIHSLKLCSATAPSHENAPPLSGEIEALFDEHAIAGLKVTTWQIRSLLIPGAVIEDILTADQHRAYLLRSGTISTFTDLFGLRPAIPRRAPIEITGEDNVDCFRSRDKVLGMLFGELERPIKEREYPADLFTLNLPPSGSPQLSTSMPISTPAPTSALRSSVEVIPVPTVRGLSQLSTRGSGPSSPARPDGRIPLGPYSGRRRNPFAGKTFTPAKRKASASDGPDPKVPRLIDLTVEDLKEEFKAQKGALDQVRLEAQADRERLSADWKNNWQQWRAEAKADKEQIQAEFKAGHQELKVQRSVDKQELLNSISNIATRTNKEMDAMHVGIRAVEDSLGEIRQVVQEVIKAELAPMKLAISSLKEEFAKEVSELKSLLARPPVLGQDGYLTQACPAPVGCQQEYESTLLEAASYYIELLGCPDEGVSADEAAMESTMRKFPELREDHIVIALEHAHIQAYDCPFS